MTTCMLCDLHLPKSVTVSVTKIAKDGSKSYVLWRMSKKLHKELLDTMKRVGATEIQIQEPA